MGVEEVLTGMSGSRLDHPMEFIESRNEVDAIASSVLLTVASAPRLCRATLYLAVSEALGKRNGVEREGLWR